VFEEASPVEHAVAEAIREAAHPHVAALGERLGRDLLGTWGYRRTRPQEHPGVAA
jgi:hypothetical protein